MALRNPIFSDKAFQPNGQTSLTPPSAPYGAQQAGAASTSQAAQNAAFQAQMEGMYAAPPAGTHETGRMTVEDTVWKTAGLFGIMLVTAVVSWFITLGGTAFTEQARSINMAPWVIGALGTLVLGLVITFTSRKKVRPALIFVYAGLEGLLVGGISAFFEMMWPGVVMQAVLATVAVVATTLTLFSMGIIRASARATKVFLIAMVGYLVFSLLNLILMWTNVIPAGEGFGLRSQEIMGIPLGLILGVLVVIMAAYSLVLDFDGIQQGVRNGAPRSYGWLSAFGIMVTVVWLYIEILRMIAIARGND